MQRLFPPLTSGGPSRETSDDQLLLDAAAPEPRGDSPSRSFVRFSMVSSLDARISVDGTSAALSSPADSRRFHLLRCAADAVVVGAGTARIEGYRGALLPQALQDVRRHRGATALPATVVLSARASLPHDAPVLTDAPAATYVVVAEDAPRERTRALSSRIGTERLITVAAGADPHQITAALASRGLLHLHHEGGPGVLGHYLAADAVDSLCLTLAPSVVASGPGLTGEATTTAPRGFHLHLLYEEESFLLADYRRAGRAAHGGDA
jgi:riboflavin biosynthesis pyrimidine reductase